MRRCIFKPYLREYDVPKELHNSQSDYPLAPEKLEINSEMQSPFQKVSRKQKKPNVKGESNPKSFSLNFFPHFLKFMGMHQIREFLNFRVIHVPYIVPKKSGSDLRCRVLSTSPAKQESSNILMWLWP